MEIHYLFLLYSAKRRARQKERLAQRNVEETSAPIDGVTRPESLHEVPVANSKDREQLTKLVQPAEGKAPVIDLEGPNSKPDSSLRMGKTLKHKLGGHLNLPVKSLDHQESGPSCANSVPSSNLLPVLGLCAPNATQMESSQRNFSGSYSRQVTRPEFPFHIAPCPGTSNEMDVKGHDPTFVKFKLPDASAEALRKHLKNSNPDNYLPFGLVLSLSLSLSLSAYAGLTICMWHGRSWHMCTSACVCILVLK